MTRLSNRILCGTAISALFLGACGGSGGGNDTPPPPQSVAPTSSFTASSQSGQVPFQVSFSDSSTSGSSNITSWQWDFGDGTTSTDQNPTHTYDVAGDFDVTLTVTTSVGSDDQTNNDFISVDPASGFLSPSGTETKTVGGVDVLAASNEVLAFFQEDVTADQLTAFAAAVEAAGAFRVAFDEDLLIYQLSVPDGVEEADVIAALEGEAGLVSASFNEAQSLDRQAIDTNTGGYNRYLGDGGQRPGSFFLGNAPATVPAPTTTSFAGDFWIDQINAPAAWLALSNVTLEDNSIGVVDTGLPASQSSLDAARVTRLSQTGEALTDDDSFSVQTHGRDVVSFAAGYVQTDDSSVRGVNPHSSVISVDVYEAVTDEATEVTTYKTDLLRGAKTAIDQGVTAVNISWGDRSKCDATSDTRLNSRRNWRSSGPTSIVNYARSKNVTAVFSSGNNCEKQDNQLLNSTDDINADSWESHAMIVGASNSARRDACFARMGDVVDIVAPGASVGFGDGRQINGTSFSAPMVTGAIGLVRAVNASISAPEAKAILVNSASTNLGLSTAEQNRAECTGRTQPTEEAWSASGPKKLLDLNGAIQTALLAKDVALDSLAAVSLGKDETTEVTVDVTLPETGVTSLDLIFVIDQSGSYGNDINTLQAQASSIIDELGGREIDVQYAVAGFADFPISPFGDLSSGDYGYKLITPMTANIDDVIAGIESLDQPLHYGADGPESQYEALYQVATGAGRDIDGDGAYDSVGEYGPADVGFRDGALPVVLFATDADFHDSDVEEDYPGAGRTETLEALTDNNLVVFGLQSGGSSAASARLNELADVTGGGVFELDSASSEIAQAISDAIDAATAIADVKLEILAGADWVTSISPAVVEDVEPGETASFTVTLTGLRNQSIDDLAYEVYFWARANDTALVRRVLQTITVPAAD